MANNNYAGFAFAANQYNAPGPGYSNASVSYPSVTNTAYGGGGGGAGGGFQPPGLLGGNGCYPSGIPPSGGYGGYGPDYSRAPLHPYDASKTYYQQAVSNYTSGPAMSINKSHYSAPPMKHANSIGPKSSLAKGPDTSGIGKQAAGPAAATITPGMGNFTNYDAALYSAASVYVAQKHGQGQGLSQGLMPKANGIGGGNASNNWPLLRKGALVGSSKRRAKMPLRTQQLHYCEVCKISCAGPQTYREHLEGQKHKKREASLKMQVSAQTTSQNRGNNYHCELCDVTCTGTDAYAAHVRGAKHQKVVKLHQKLGKPIPTDEPKKVTKVTFVPAAATPTAADTASTSKTTSADNPEVQKTTTTGTEAQGEGNVSNVENTDNIKPVGGEYIEEVRDDEGKILSFNCKLCDCKFNDPNAKEMHMKGRRHRLQYKRKVQPDLVVDFKPTPRQRRLAEARAQRALMQAHRHVNNNFSDTHENGNYWEDQRRRSQYEEDYDYGNWIARGFGNQRFGVVMGNVPAPFYTMILDNPNVRRPESSDDRHAIARHAEIYPKEEELQIIQRIVSHTERALKFVSDALAEGSGVNSAQKNAARGSSEKDGRDNQLLSFQMDADSANTRKLKGVMRVGFLAKGLLLQGDNSVELVVLCSDKPTVGLLKRVAAELPNKLKQIVGENPVNYKVEMQIDESAVMVSDDNVSVKVSLTSPLLRESNESSNCCTNNSDDATENEELLPREPCLKALAELRHAKWFQARATGLQSCVMVIRILRDLRQRIQSWQALPQWSLELLMEKIISSAGFPISPGDCLRRTMETLASGFLINGPGLLDPCEKEPTDALENLSRQQREDLTVSAQLFLRYIAFRQIYKVLGMEQLPPLKFPLRSWRLNRKRRRTTNKSGQSADCNAAGDAGDSVSDEKIPKKDNKMAIP